MSYWRVVAILAIVAAISNPIEGHAIDNVALVNDTHCDVVFFGDEGLTVLRLTVRVNGQPIAQAREEYITSLFVRFDANQDGVLDQNERQAFRAITDILSTMTRPQPVAWELPRDESGWSRGKFAEFMESQLGRSIEVTTQNPPQASQLESSNSGLFSAIDANRDGKLQPSEFNLPRRMLRRDWDEDDSLSRSELFPEAAIGGPQLNRSPSTSSPITKIQVVDPRATGSAFASQLISKYDRTWASATGQKNLPDFMLSPDELTIPPDLVRTYDHDQNGNLDVLELRAYWQNPVPVWHVDVQAGENSSMKLVPGTVSNQAPSESVTVSRFNRNLIVFAPSPLSWPKDVEAFARERFAQFDRDKNEYLELREIAGFSARMPTSVYDRDQDTRIYFPEFFQVIREQSALARTRITLSFRGVQNGLFETIDANSDQKISTAEVSRVGRLVPILDLNRDGGIGETEIPNIWVLTAAVPSTLVMLFPANSGNVVNSTSTVRTDAIPGVPRWFSFMDRNRDRFVSRREFLGKSADFARMDSDNDGALDSEEATKAEF
jgi:Ca2+-binding EF-hand superfamily protein